MIPQPNAKTAPDLIDRDTIEAALEQADPTVLRIILLQLTGDPAIAAMQSGKRSIRGGMLMLDTLLPEHHAEVRARMLEYLSEHLGEPWPAPPALQERRELMDLFNGKKLSDIEFRFAHEELAFEDVPRDAVWAQKPATQTIEAFKVAIIGAGVSGIAAAVQLKRLGIPFEIIERQNDIGGTWTYNRYPGVRVDVTAFLYQFSFEKNYPWKEYYPQGSAIKEYLDHIIDRHDLREHIRLSTEVVEGAWAEGESRWELKLRGSNGQEEMLNANVVFSAAGLFNKPKLPNIPGVETFAGEMVHTTAWHDGIEVKGKRVAVIGNGSTGTQTMPEIARVAAATTVYQRTPQWISELENYRAKITAEVQWLFDNVPYYWNWFIFAFFIARLQVQALQVIDKEWQAKGGLINEPNDKMRESLIGYIERKLAGRPDLISKVMPDFAPVARRPVVDNGWYEALLSDSVELVTGSIERITPSGIVSEDGVERSFDTIVLSTGFEVGRYMWPVRYTGRDGVTLETAWAKDGARAYLGMVMPGFPNFFMFYGPNGQTRSGGFFSWAEVWARYAAGAVVQMIEQGNASIECRTDVFERYNAEMDAATKNLIWETEGSKGYYVNEHGRSGVNMSWTVEQYYGMVERPQLSDYIVR